MTHISKKRLSPKSEAILKNSIFQVYKNVNSKDLRLLIPALITETEMLMIAKRLATVIMLADGYSYLEISRSLHLTKQTISRINLDVNTNPDIYKKIFNKLKPQKRRLIMKAILKEIGLEFAKLAVKHAGGRIY